MKGKDVEIGKVYAAKVSGVITEVQITGPHTSYGWSAVNLRTGRPVRIRSAQRLRYLIGA